MAERISVSLKMRPCRALASMLLALHLAAAIPVLVLDLPLWIRAGLVVLLAYAACHVLRRHALLISPQACISLRIRDDGQCRWQLRAGTELTGTLLPRWFASPWLTVLRLNLDQSQATALLLTPCKLDHEAYRQLRVLLANRL